MEKNIQAPNIRGNFIKAGINMIGRELRPVENPKLKQAIKKVKKDPSAENSSNFLNEIVRAEFIIPVSIDRPAEIDKTAGDIILEKDTEISFELIKTESGKLYYPLFTDGAELEKCKVRRDQQNLIVNFDDMAAILLQPQNQVEGFTVNPMSDDMRFSVDIIAAMKKEMDAEREKGI